MNEKFKVNVNKFSSSERLYTIIEVNHSELVQPLRIVNDNEPLKFNNQDYMPFPFTFVPLDQKEGELPVATLTIPNFSSQIVKWIDVSNGAMNAKMTISIVRKNETEPDYKITFSVESISIETQRITFSLSIQNNLVKRAIRWRYDTEHAKGLF